MTAKLIEMVQDLLYMIGRVTRVCTVVPYRFVPTSDPRTSSLSDIEGCGKFSIRGVSYG
jgi:hypothetical protein